MVDVFSNDFSDKSETPEEAKMKSSILSILSLFLFIPFLLQASEFQVKIIKDADDLPKNFCTIWEKGDYLISDGQYFALLGGVPRPLRSHLLNFPDSNAMGSILSFAPAGENIMSNLSIGSPILRIKERRKYLTYTSLDLMKETKQKGTLAFRASALYKGKNGQKAEIQTTYHLLPEGRINIVSTIKNTGKVEFKDLSFDIYFGPHHRYYFSPFDSEEHPDLNFRFYQKKEHYLGWMDLNPVQPEEDEEVPTPGDLAPGEEFRLNYILLVDTQVNDLLNKIYRLLNIEPEKASILFKDFDGDQLEVIVRDAISSSIFFRSFLKDTFKLEIVLPEGAYLVRANFFPAVCEEFLVVEKGKKNRCLIENPPHGKVKVKIRNSKGEFIPGKVTFIGLDPTKTPCFKPEDPIKSGRKWETFKNSCYPSEEGLEVKVPVGTYLVSASRGPEYSVDQKAIEILKGKKVELVFQIDKVVKTKNLVCIDPHMHTLNSDARVSIAERIKSVVAEGVDVAVASDHNFISDYHPIIKKLSLNEYLAVIPGSEVTTKGVIHYNSYPLELRKNEEHNGAIYPLAEEIIPLFEASRRKDPQAIIQVNHPRDGDLGYFNNYRLDKESASLALLPFDTSFDVLEVMNGPYFYSDNRLSIEDWFHLLNRGYYFPIVGSSDSHSIDKQEPGYSRTYVFYKGEKGDNLNCSALIQAIKKGQSFATNGPLVDFKINNLYTSGDTFTEMRGEVNVSLKVQSAPWISVNEVCLILNGERKIIFPVKFNQESILKFSEEVGLRLKKDSYIAVEVIGDKSLYPVLQKIAMNGDLEEAALPYALTNPVFVDVDGNGKFDPPWPEKIKFAPDIPE